MIRGIRSIIKLVSQEVKHPQYLYGLTMTSARTKTMHYVFITIINTIILWVTKIKYKEALLIWDKYDYDFNRFVGETDKT